MTGPVSERGRGLAAAAFAFVLWGFFPIYFRRLDALPAAEILAWRILCASLTLAPVLLVVPGPRALGRRLAAVRRWWPVPAATLLIAVNWLAFIHAIETDRVLEGSLGYFLVPLVNSALGMAFFGERPNRWRRAALGVAALGMLGALGVAVVVAGSVPLLALTLALSWGLYGAVRKGAELDSATGLLLETLLLAPFAIAWLVAFGTPLDTLPGATRAWLFASGALTLVPLLALVAGARRIDLGTLGMLQYITPVMQFAVAVGLYGERLDAARVIAFSTTLAAIALWLVGLRAGTPPGGPLRTSPSTDAA